MAQRSTRSQTRQRQQQQQQTTEQSESTCLSTFTLPFLVSSKSSVEHLPANLSRHDTNLSTAAHALLLAKQRKLHALDLIHTHATRERFTSQQHGHESQKPPADPKNLEDALVGTIKATLTFSSEHAGTAVFIAPTLILTCAHCLVSSRRDFTRTIIRKTTFFWLLSATGYIVKTQCLAWDERRDLALLRVVAVQDPQERCEDTTSQVEGDTSIAVASCPPSPGTVIICIGHPGSEDFEADTDGVQTFYPVLAVSKGRFLGYSVGQDVHDNSEMGALVHDAWTYWGHSGAPLVDGRTGRLVGLHSSWDEETGLRRGVAGEAIVGFLMEVARRLEREGGDRDGEVVCL